MFAQEFEIRIGPVDAVSVGYDEGDFREAQVVKVSDGFGVVGDRLGRDGREGGGVGHVAKKELSFLFDDGRSRLAPDEKSADVLGFAVEGKADAHFRFYGAFEEDLIQKGSVGRHLAVEPDSGLFRLCLTVAESFVDQVFLEQGFAAEETKTGALAFRESKVARLVKDLFGHVFGAFLTDAVTAVHVAVFCQMQSKIHKASPVSTFVD